MSGQTGEERLRIRLPEVYRYLGCRGGEPDEAVKQAVSRCAEELGRTVRPAWLTRIFGLECPGGDEVRFAGYSIRSRNLAENLKGCREICLMAATLGSGVDRLLARTQLIRMSDAVILQAEAASAIECLCDRICRELAESMKEKGLYLRPRFSPGYGDFPLEFQKDLIRILDASKRIGITLTDGMLMSPSKSVTAVIGLSPADTACVPAGCEACAKTDCAYRRS